MASEELERAWAALGCVRDRLVRLEAVADAARAVRLAAKEHFPNMCYIAGGLDALLEALDALDKEE